MAPRATPTFLQAGFRPFFLLAALGALVIMLRTLLVFSGLAPSPAGGPVQWHGHELLFGVLAAAMAGFLLTAVPNWTGARPVQGLPLLFLAVLWLLGRAALWPGAPNGWLGLLDVAFLPAAALLAFRPLLRGGSPRQWLPAGVILVFAATNAAWHVGATLGAPVLTDRAIAFAAMLVALLIAIIGGRITPAFTRNRMRAAGAQPLPRETGRRDVAALAASALAALAELGAPSAAAGAALVAGALHAVRLHGWRGSWAVRDPLLFALHAGYAWLVIGYLARAAPLLDIGSAGAWPLHGILAGGAGTMVLAVMARATLGHTGRPLRAGVTLTMALLLIQAAAIVRLAAPWSGVTAWILAAVLWCAAFGLFLGRCAPMLLGPRADAA